LIQQVVFRRYGPPDVLEIREAERPIPGPGEVGIVVGAAGVNFADVLARMGLYPDAPRPPLVPGFEVAGVVDAVGVGVTQIRAGDRVVALTRFGGYATYVTVPADYAFPLSPGVSDCDAAALPVNYLTAYLAVCRFANVAEGETVLIHGAGGGVGIAATQLACRRAAIIIGTASVSKHERLRGFGVAHTIDSAAPDMDREVRLLTKGRGVDVALDSIGGASFRTSYRLLAPLGRLVIYGVSSIAPGRRRNWWHAARTVMAMPSFKSMSLMNRNRGVFGLNLAHLWDERGQLSAAMAFLLEELRQGHVRPVVAKTFPLKQAADAHHYLQSRASVGKVILSTT
jgi:NADPH:quinone reductase-like Zn-dependent oxidoreductase